MKRRTTLMAAAVLMLLPGAAFAAEGAATGNGTSTEAGPASSPKMSTGAESNGAGSGGAAAMGTSGTKGSKGEANGTSTLGGPANK